MRGLLVAGSRPAFQQRHPHGFFGVLRLAAAWAWVTAGGAAGSRSGSAHGARGRASYAAASRRSGGGPALPSDPSSVPPVDAPSLRCRAAPPPPASSAPASAPVLPAPL